MRKYPPFGAASVGILRSRGESTDMGIMCAAIYADVSGQYEIIPVVQHVVDAGVKFAVEISLPTVRFEDRALTSTRSADNTSVRVQVLRRQRDGSWLRIMARPEVPRP